MIPTELNAPSSSTPPLGTRIITALTRRRHPQLFPSAAARPLALAWVWLLPQALLLFLNLRAWNLISGEVNPFQRTSAITIFSLEVALWLGGAALFSACLLRKTTVPRLAGGGLLLGASLFLSFCFVDGGSAIPNSVQAWMLPPDQWLFNQFALVGIGALYGAFRLLCPDRENDLVSGSVVTVAALFSPFVLILLAMGAAMSSTFLRFGPEPLRYVFGPLYLAASLLSVGAVLRICISAYVFARKSSPLSLGILTFIVALALPIAGLLLNSSIGFPADFQLPVIYALAIANGLILTLPNFSNPILHRIVWLAQCALFPFTAYFFAVFLPQLPLMPIAAICFALGLLICVPSALFLLHGCRLLDGLRAEIRDGSRWLPTALAIGAIASGPVLITGKIISDRASLNQALDYLQYPDYAHPSAFPGNRNALRSALLNLRDFKEGHYLPFYSEFYNWLAFDNLLLPDRKLAEVWRTFFGGDMPPSTTKRSTSPFSPWSRGGRSNQEILSGLDGARPSANATTKSLRTSVLPAQGEVRATASITIENPTNQTTEYWTLIHVPAGVWISGMRLTIGSTPVPAQLFEERAALWVYSKITEASVRPRDPGILRYLGPDSAELRVFPVEGKGERSVEIDFVYPDNIAPAITIDGRPLALPPATRNVALSSDATIWVPPASLSNIPAIQRIPQPQFIVDISKDSLFQKNPAALHEAILDALRAFPAAETARLFFANFNLREFRNGQAISVTDLRQANPAELLAAAGAFEGGFREVFAIESTLASSVSANSTDPTREFPIPVVLRGNSHPKEDEGPLASFARFAPDEPSWWSLEPHSSMPQTHRLDPAAPGAGRIVGVHLLKLGPAPFAIRDGEVGVYIATGDTASLALTAYDSSKQTFIPIASATNPGAGSAAGAEVWKLASRRIFEPSPSPGQSLSSLLDVARRAGILAPSTAYMVVENTAQWKMLDRTEKKTLKAHEAFALSNSSATPEPGTIALLLVAGAALLAYRKFFRHGLHS